MIEPEILDQLRSITARTGLSKSEQIRQGIRWWLESREWPVKSPRAGPALDADAKPPGRARRRRP